MTLWHAAVKTYQAMSEYSQVEVVHYRLCPAVHSTVGEAAKGAHEGFNESDKFLTLQKLKI
jgi:hypothetical protein